ncbi:zf-HC2 domain-containing protein [Candidatus Binatus sp.]|uniref:zf-HC2 domain-containing protein n=1 Tax=Candidatus Binatus sp. TaxID=2811406 RepID=UPI003C7620AA
MRRGKQIVQREVTCRQFVGLIGRLRDGELSDVDRRSFLQHRRECARCSDYLKGYELTISAAKRIAEDSRDSSETVIPRSLVNRILDSRLKNGSGS